MELISGNLQDNGWRRNAQTNNPLNPTLWRVSVMPGFDDRQNS
jgi:hypothetical protein